MEATQKTYLPAAGHDFFLPLYDPLVKLLGGDAVRRTLLDLASIQPGQRILDIGCGTGSLVVMLKRLYPDVDVVGLDPDPKALARATRKAAQAFLFVQFDRGYADELPYADASVDRVLSSFMFHHLPRDAKAGMLREVRRVLRPGGLFGLVDFDGPDAGGGGFLTRLFHSNQQLSDNADERILALMNQAGLANPRKIRQDTLLLGLMRLNYFQASI
ncbi:MAG: class I SAM-dependent methyltransferase [Blastocatellia bacterium]